MAESLAAHLEGLIDNISQIANTAESDARRNLLNALRQAQQEAAANGVQISDGAGGAEIAAALGNLRAGDAVAEAIGIREIAGDAPYEEFDPHWAESLLNYYHTGKNRTPFRLHDDARPPIDPERPLVAAPSIRIAIAGDWGTGEAAALAVADQIKRLEPHYTIHLGDVYYSGLPDEEQRKFLAAWPHGGVGDYTLNSNHEMYCGGAGYFNTLLNDRRFLNSQQGLSYFALSNEHWLIVGLDTAYFAYYQSLLYENGSLFEPDAQREPKGMAQLEWFAGLLARHPGKRVILLTHHDGFDVHPVTGAVTPKPLYGQVTGAMSAVHDWWWYWGHVHAGIAYERIFFAGDAAMTARCVGHGAIPYLPWMRDLEKLGDGTVRVAWAETDLARNGGDARRAPNGFLMLTLSGAELREQFYDELGRVRWSNF
jgi:hypothetical protein